MDASNDVTTTEQSASIESAPPDASPRRMRVRALYVGSRIDLRAMQNEYGFTGSPIVLSFDDRGWALIYRFGVIVAMGLLPDEESRVADMVRPFLVGSIEPIETEETSILIDPSQIDRVDASGLIVLQSSASEKLHVVASVVAKSAVLSHFEIAIMQVFDRVEEFARELTSGRSPNRSRDLLRELGSTLIIQTQTVGRVEVTEKPELTWEKPELDRFYERLADEYELRDRDIALTRKLQLISSTAQTYLELLHSRQSIRVEWYIVFLIVFEILIVIFELIVK